MIELKIDDELKNLIRPLTFDERTGLKENLIKNGCLDAIKTWNDFIVDGHNRYEICTENDIEFRTDELEFEDKDDVKVWMIRQQLDKRNVNDYIRTSLCLKMEGIFQEKAKANMVEASHPKKEVNVAKQNSAKQPLKKIEPMETRAEIAKMANVSTDTVSKVKYIEEHATEEQKESLRNDTPKASIHSVYTKLKKQEPLPVLLDDPLADIDDFDGYANACTYKPQLLKDQQGFELCPCGCGYAFYRFDKKWYSKEEWTDKYV